MSRKTKRTTSRIPTWSPTVVLTGPGNAWLRWADGKRYYHCCMVVLDHLCHLQHTNTLYFYIYTTTQTCTIITIYLIHHIDCLPTFYTYIVIITQRGTSFAIMQYLLHTLATSTSIYVRNSQAASTRRYPPVHFKSTRRARNMRSTHSLQPVFCPTASIVMYGTYFTITLLLLVNARMKPATLP